MLLRLLLRFLPACGLVLQQQRLLCAVVVFAAAFAAFAAAAAEGLLELGVEVYAQICMHLPLMLSLKRWELGFCLKLHGVSFQT